MEYSLSELQEDAERQYNNHKATMRERYALARKLGFTPQEATILKTKTEETIKRLASEREASNA